MIAPLLEPIGDAKVALNSVNVDATLENLLSKVTIRQIYENLEDKNIEAVYTFPLPVHAVLLNMEIKIGSRELKGVVVEKSEAEERYEDAITDGDTAIMLEQIEPGLYTMNVGNLMPKEKVEISFTYAELYRWQNDSLRFFLPTTIAPRYGDPERVCIEPHQIPEYDLMADNPFQIRLTVHGFLKDASFESPSHKIKIQKDPKTTVIALADGEALMDRDFVLNMHSDSIEKNFAIIDRDVDGYAILTSFNPTFPVVKKEFPRSIKIVVDCSGSMGGDSIAQARNALAEITTLLRPQDYFNIIKFGSDYKMLFKKQVQASENNLTKAKRFVRTLDADMGGTEMEKALSAAIKSPSPKDISKKIFLITDGEVWEGKNIVNRLRDSKHRFFTVGVGSAVSEGLLKSLAEKTGGACELVSPKEEMAEKIVRHCKRIFLPKAEKVTVSCQNSTFRMIPQNIDPVYDGDTVIVFSRLKEKQGGPIIINYMLEDGQTFSQTTDIQDLTTDTSESAYENYPGTIARLAAHEELKFENNKEKIADIGVKYQLINEYTNFIVIDVRAEDKKAKDLPVLKKVPQMLAAGWGGTGSVIADALPCYSFKMPFPDSKYSIESVDSVRHKTDRSDNFLRDFYQRRNKEYTIFIENVFQRRKERQRILFDKLFQWENHVQNIDINNLSNGKLETHIKSIRKQAREDISTYMEFVNELAQREINEQYEFIEDLIHREIENYRNILEEEIRDQDKFIHKLIHYFSNPIGKEITLPTLNTLKSMGLDPELVRNLSELIDGENNTKDVITAFLYVLLNKPFEFVMPKQVKRIIRKKYKESPQNQDLFISVKNILINANKIA